VIEFFGWVLEALFWFVRMLVATVGIDQDRVNCVAQGSLLFLDRFRPENCLVRN
jgi:hypothetical protein